MNTPEWLTKREGSLRQGVNGSTWMVTLSGHPYYRLFATPAGGQITCAITQANNGKRLDGGKKYPSEDAAIQGGLEELRDTLGW